MKKGKIIFATMMVVLLGLTALGENNLNFGINLFGEDREVLSREDLNKFMNESIVTPIKKCYIEAYPHVFMTKCYLSVEFRLNRPDWIQEDSDWTFYKDETLKGKIVLINCGDESYICGVKVNYAKSEIFIQESFFSQVVDHKTYLEDFCSKITEQAWGVEE